MGISISNNAEGLPKNMPYDNAKKLITELNGLFK